MTTRSLQLEVSDELVEVVFKDIKNLHVSVHPPAGRVRVSAPLRLDNETVRSAVASRLAWIRRQQRRLVQQERQSQREMVNGESHFFRGRRYRLKIREGRPAGVQMVRSGYLELTAKPGADRATRERVLTEWYRQHLKSVVPGLVKKWADRVGIAPRSVGIRRMKTRWGTCNADKHRIWLNLELAKKPPSCVEYVLVHEMVHLLERKHTDRFRELMDEFMPHWRVLRDELTAAPLAHEEWNY